MKKIIKRAFAVLAVFVIFTVSFVTISAFAFRDEISDSDKRIIDKTILFMHNTEKGEDLEMSLGCGIVPISEDTYLVNILFNADYKSNNYKTKNVRIVSNVNNHVNILSAFYSADGPTYTVPAIDFSDKKEIQCFSENGYIELKMLLSGEELDSLSFDVEYDVIGEGLYSNNIFHQSWDGLEFALDSLCWSEF